MIKTISINREELEIYLNKKGYKFLGFYKDEIIFTFTEKTTRQIVAKTNTEKFFELTPDELGLYSKQIAERLGENNDFIQTELEKFINYWSQKSEGDRKYLWQKQKSFEVPNRFRTWLDNTGKYNKKDLKPKNGGGIRKI